MWIIVAVYVVFSFLMARLAFQALQNVRRSSPEPSRSLPTVSLIKPVKGANEFSERKFRSWVESRYPGRFEVIFSFQDPADPGLEIARRFSSQDHVKVIVNPILDGYSGKASNLEHGLRIASGECIVFSDADTLAEPGTLREIISRLADGRALVSCLPVHTSALNFWGRLYSTLWNLALIGLWAPSMISGRAPGVAGGTVAFWRRDLEKVGGIPAFSNFIAEDLRMGALFQREGFELRLGPVVVSEVGGASRQVVWNALVRAGFVSLSEESGGLIKSLLLNLFAYGYAPLFFVSLFTPSLPLAPLMALAVTKILFLSYINFLAESRWRLAWATPVNDIICLAALVTALKSRRVNWAGVTYCVDAGGRLQRLI